MKESNLLLSEAVLLGTAMVQDTCRRRNVRALFLKGPAATKQGVRPNKPSSDIDVLICHADLGILVSTLESSGWTIRGEGWEEYYSSHSVTLFHNQWPCDIDVHYRFPGISAPSEQAFELLYDEREHVQLAGHAIEVPGPLGSVCIQALHALRNPWLAAQRNNFDFLTNEHAAPDLDQLSSFTGKLGATAAMKPYFDAVYDMPESFAWPRPSREWLARTTARTRGSIRLMELIDAPWREKIRIMYRQITPNSGMTIDIVNQPTADSSMFSRISSPLRLGIDSVREAALYIRKRRGSVSE